MKQKKQTKFIKKIMIDRELTVPELALLVNRSRKWVSQVINGHYRPAKTRIRIAATLDVPYEHLWGEPEPKDAA